VQHIIRRVCSGHNITYQQWNIAQEANLPCDLVGSSFGQGVCLWAQARAEHHAAVATSALPGTVFPAAYIESLRSAAQWLGTASELAKTHRFVEQGDALLHLSCVWFDLGKETEALAALKQFLQEEVDRARRQCRGCRQSRGEDAPMLTCGGCGVARFCSEKHQRLLPEREIACAKPCGTRTYVRSSRNGVVCPRAKLQLCLVLRICWNF